MAGALVEKAKTTPEAYPLSLNAVCVACNQKSNRAPIMQLGPEQVQESLDRLRQMGAVGLIEGQSRVSKYRHYLYDWLGVDKVEMAIMTELLLRGDQTVGELRIRASRMEPIADLNTLHALLAGLTVKGMVISLTPEGRGHVVSHALYLPPELERLKARYSQQRAGDAAAIGADDSPGDASGGGAVRQELDELKEQLAQLQSTVSDLSALTGRLSDELHRLKSELGTS